MKRFVVSLFVAIAMIFSFCSDTRAVVDSVRFQQFYAGAVWTGGVSESNNGNINNNVSVMTGAQAIVGNPEFYLTGRFVWRPDVDFAHVWGSSSLRGNILKYGFMSRPLSIFRPHPVSFSGHSELPSKQVIPGSTWGVMWQKSSLKAGFYRNKAGHAEGDIGFDFSQLSFAGLGSNQQWAGAISWKVEKIGELLIFADDDSTASVFGLINTEFGDPYISWVADTDRDFSRRHLEIGVTRDFAGEGILGLFGFGCDFEAEAVNLYFAVYRE